MVVRYFSIDIAFPIFYQTLIDLGSLVISVILPQSPREHREKMIKLCALWGSVASLPFTEQRISREIPKSLDLTAEGTEFRRERLQRI